MEGPQDMKEESGWSPQSEDDDMKVLVKGLLLEFHQLNYQVMALRNMLEDQFEIEQRAWAPKGSLESKGDLEELEVLKREVLKKEDSVLCGLDEGKLASLVELENYRKWRDMKEARKRIAKDGENLEEDKGMTDHSEPKESTEKN